MKRDRKLDTLKGILIILVVLGHSGKSIIHDIIFLFHMPLFFILSGYLLQGEKLKERSYIKTKITTFMIPYYCYLLTEFLLIRQDFSFQAIIKLFWGGRAIPGVYWYITCFVTAIIFFAFMINHISNKMVKHLIFLGGGIAIIESHLSEQIHLLKSPGIPWNMDVALLAMVYLAIGFYYKEQIKLWLGSLEWKYDIFAIAIAIILLIFCVWNYSGEKPYYYFDMKPLYYKELVAAIVIPCAFGAVLARFVYWLDRCRLLGWLQTGLCCLGQMTIPIMFMHIPFNNWQKTMGYGILVYVLIGIGLPVIFTMVCQKFALMRLLFGIPMIRRTGFNRDTQKKLT